MKLDAIDTGGGIRAYERIEAVMQFGYPSIATDTALYMDFETLLMASDKVKRGVTWKSSTQNYVMKRLIWVSNTYARIKTGTYKTKGYNEFTIHERGKPRLIRSCHISDRTVQKAFNETILKPKIYPRLIYDNSASQQGKGTDFCLRRLKTHLLKFYRKHGNNGYALLLDFKNYFGNIDKDILICKLSKVLSDEELRFTKIFLNDDKEGLGLGSEVNQTCAIFYANDLDHFVKEKLCVKYYARYMDDSYLIHEDRNYLEHCLSEIRKVCKRDGIVLNERKCRIINLKTDNLNFLKKQIRLTDTGKVIVRPIKKNYIRRKHRLVEQSKQLRSGKITKQNIDSSYKSWRGFIVKYNAPYYLLEQFDTLYAISRKGKL